MAKAGARRSFPTLGGTGDRTAIIEPGRGTVSYERLERAAAGVADVLSRRDIGKGARVGLYARRSADVIAAMLGTLRAGAAYVPVDPAAPVARNAGIFSDCGVQLVLAERRYLDDCRSQLRQLGAKAAVESIEESGQCAGLEAWIARNGGRPERALAVDGEVAYVLYTSGSTGRPKGVTISRENAAVFIDWANDVFAPTSADIFANHAQFNFDISVLDIYLSLAAGASLVIVPDHLAGSPANLVGLLESQRITIWYSAPAILAFVAQLPELERRQLDALRIVAFAGEVFPIGHFNSLRKRLPGARYLNLYGPTETNVCTYYEVPRTAGPFETPLPIGGPCAHYLARVLGPNGERVARGGEGELLVRGPGVMMGYWNQPSLTAERMLEAEDGGPPWYRTGDLVVEGPNGSFRYLGRCDRMVKVRGYRVEPGEVEARLYELPQVREVAVVPVTRNAVVSLVAHVSTQDGQRLSTIRLKEFCADKLPAYMIPEQFQFHGSLPRTSTGKVDVQSLMRGS
jgi:amino acid adenylation domain-containing protein